MDIINTLKIAISWAALLSPYDTVPEDAVQLKIVDTAFMVENACNGHQRCPVFGWYNYGDTIYIHERINLDSMSGMGLLIHEVVHFLQMEKYGEPEDCETRIQWEYEAYKIQDEFLIQNGTMPGRRNLFLFRC